MGRTIIKRPVLAAVKLSGGFTHEDRQLLRAKAWSKSTDGATMTMTSTDFGRESALFFDVYVVEQLSLLKRLRHTFRVFKAAIARNIGVHPRVIVITLK